MSDTVSGGAGADTTGQATIGGGAEGRDTIALAGSMDTLYVPHRQPLTDEMVYTPHGTQEGRMTAQAMTQEEEEAAAKAATVSGASSTDGGSGGGTSTARSQSTGTGSASVTGGRSS